MTELRQVFTTPCGAQFDTKAEALDFLRRPKILAALNVVTGGNKDLAQFLADNSDTVESAFETGAIKRVTKAEAKKLEKALESLVEIEGNPAIAFLQQNADAIKSSFRWPSVKRMTDEEKNVQARNTLMAATENNEELVTWILTSKEQILQAYGAGIVKRAVNPKAQEALAAYQLRKAEEKAARLAAEAETAQ